MYFSQDKLSVKAKQDGEYHGRICARESSKDHEPYVLPKSWATEVDNMSPPVFTSSRAGKSTFARTLLNRLLVQFERVAYLECDSGQSEFTSGGMAALNIIEDHCFGTLFPHSLCSTTERWI
ncbi:hypothetical protein AX14_013549 [Amanita brunnescens Koide BX004]|nr:hypothetical protein AX14_013549 [Amanita brunnescens Koide BX004]